MTLEFFSSVQRLVLYPVLQPLLVLTWKSQQRASKKEKEKSIPTYKDLDFIQDMPEGLMLDADTFSALVKTLQRDCLVRSGRLV